MCWHNYTKWNKPKYSEYTIAGLENKHHVQKRICLKCGLIQSRRVNDLDNY